MKFEELKKMAAAKPLELTDEQLEQASGGIYIGAYERMEIDGVVYVGCPSCGEARKLNSGERCPVCGMK